MKSRGRSQVVATTITKSLLVAVLGIALLFFSQSEPAVALRNVVERFFNRAKHHRRVATRYDKTDSSDFSFVCLASIMTNLLNAPTTLRCLRDYF